MFELIFAWLGEHRREPGYLADLCSMTLERLTMIVCGRGVPTDDEVMALADATGIPPEELKRGAETAPGMAAVNAAQCYSAADLVSLLRVSAETAYNLMTNGQLYWTFVGEKLKRVPHFALLGYLMGYSWEVQRVMACAPPSHLAPDGQTPPETEDTGDASLPPRVPPERDEGDGPPPGRLL